MGKKDDPLQRLEASFHEVWLAGLGAWAQAEKKGDKLFRTLVKKGRKFQREAPAAGAAVKDSVEGVREQARQAWKDLTEELDRQVAETLKRVGLATASEIEALESEIAKLKTTAAMEQLAEKRKARAKKKVKK
jgi:poly(hydroxyalkanoate) granule-associated protein